MTSRMTMIISKLAILLCLTVASAIAVGQNNSSPSNDTQGVAIHNAADLKDNHSNQDEPGSDCDKKKNKDKDKNKHERKPAPSKQEQEFEKMLQGIYG